MARSCSGTPSPSSRTRTARRSPQPSGRRCIPPRCRRVPRRPSRGRRPRGRTPKWSRPGRRHPGGARAGVDIRRYHDHDRHLPGRPSWTSPTVSRSSTRGGSWTATTQSMSHSTDAVSLARTTSNSGPVPSASTADPRSVVRTSRSASAPFVTTRTRGLVLSGPRSVMSISRRSAWKGPLSAVLAPTHAAVRSSRSRQPSSWPANSSALTR